MNILTWLKRHIKLSFYLGEPKNADEIVKEAKRKFNAEMANKRMNEFHKTWGIRNDKDRGKTSKRK